MSHAVADKATPDGRAGQRQIADHVQQLVADELIGVALSATAWDMR
jgi:hypothetical protein